MRVLSVSFAAVICGAIGFSALYAQTPNGQAKASVAAARKAAGEEWAGVFQRVCSQAAPALVPPAPPANRPPGPPARSVWYTEPVKVFDNLYFVGEKEYSSWAVTTSAGIIIIDAIYDYSVQDEVEGGLRQLGLDPASIKYVIVSHGHADHSGGAKFLQDKFGAHIILGAEDWDLLDRVPGPRPARDMVATDGMKLTLGDTTLTLYKTPGHTLGTISTLIPLKDHGVAHTAAYWGGTAFNWVSGPSAYITADRPPRFWFQTYGDSARRFRDIAARAEADVLLSNHTEFDGSKRKIPALKTRKAGDAHPYVTGKEGVLRYLTTVEQCAGAGLANSK
jgi:metallo-beta-lactamase class B